MFFIHVDLELHSKPKAYVEAIANAAPQEVLAKSNAKIVVIGCGGWEAIQSYAGTSFTKFLHCVYLMHLLTPFRFYRVSGPILCGPYT